MTLFRRHRQARVLAGDVVRGPWRTEPERFYIVRPGRDRVPMLAFHLFGPYRTSQQAEEALEAAHLYDLLPGDAIVVERDDILNKDDFPLDGPTWDQLP